MKECIGCKYAEWDKTKSGKLHPKGYGRCTYNYRIPELPISRYWVGSKPEPVSSFICRHRELGRDCPYYTPLESDELKPCPFCGSDAELKEIPYPQDSTGNGVWFTGVRCSNVECGLHNVIIRKDDWQKRA